MSEPAATIRPLVSEVAALLRARTKMRGGSEVGTFNEETRPTAAQVNDLINEALDDVLGKVKSPAVFATVSPSTEATEEYERRLRRAAALYTAVLVEMSYYPEQVGNSRSPADVYERLYNARVKALIAEGETGEPQGEGGETGGGTPGDAYYSFPDDRQAQIGLATRF